MIKSQWLIAGLVGLSLSTGGLAQSNIGPSSADVRGTRVQVGVVIPFGGAGSKSERAPRVETWSEPVRIDRAGAPLLSGDDVARPVRLGISLERQPQLMINGRAMPKSADGNRISTLGWVGIGVGVVVIVLGVAAYKGFQQMNN